jgi:aldose sugar dehydrogenase
MISRARTIAARGRVWILLAIAALVIFAAGAVARDLAGRFDLKERLTAALSRAPASEPDARTEIRTALHTVMATRQTVPGLQGMGGGIEEIDGLIVLATPEGRLGYLKPGAEVQYLSTRIPLNLEALKRSAASLGWDVMHDGGVRVLDLLIVPRAGGGRDLLVSHQTFKGSCIEFRISAIGLERSGGRLSVAKAGWRTLFVGTPCLDLQVAAPSPGVEGMCVCVGGGRMVLIDDRRILFSTGDHEFDGRGGRPKLARDPTSTLGKAMSLDLSSGVAEIYASGLRNGQGLFAAADGRVWETEHGPRGGDELNLIVKGGDYGWPEVTLGTQYDWSEEKYRFGPWATPTEEARHDGYLKPVFAFVPSIALSGLVEADAEEFPRWKNDLIVGSLVGQKLVRLRLERGAVLYAEPIEIGARIRDIIRLADGRLALWTDSYNLIFISNYEPDHAGPDRPRAAQPTLSGQAAIGRDTFNARCASCHDLSGANGAGPSLAGLMTRKIGSTPGFAYSAALAGRKDRWDEKRLKAYLSNPQAAVPGTSMPPAGVSAEEAEAVVAYLRART